MSTGIRSTTAPSPAGASAAGGPTRVLLVTGMSGAGKTTALKALEDMGYEAVDHLPLALLTGLVPPRPEAAESIGFHRPLAIGIDIRTRDFAVEPLLAEMDRLASQSGIGARIVFLDCDDDELRRRYVETRHRHPLAGDRPVGDGIAHERRLLTALRDRADLVIDTTGLAPGGLKRILEGHFAVSAHPELSIYVTSFAYRRGLPREADLVFDVRFLANPHYDPALRPQDGRAVAVADFIAADSGFVPFMEGLTALLASLLPRYAAEGKSYLTIAVGCTGGRHRSVLVAERLAAWLHDHRHRVQLHHRDLETDREDSPS